MVALGSTYAKFLMISSSSRYLDTHFLKMKKILILFIYVLAQDIRVQSVKQGYDKCCGIRANDRNLILHSCEVSSRNEGLRAVG